MHAPPAGSPDTPRPSPACPSLLVAVIAGWSLLGCGRGEPASFPTAAELPDERRRPDGVALDPASTPPPPTNQADAEDSVVTSGRLSASAPRWMSWTSSSDGWSPRTAKP